MSGMPMRAPGHEPISLNPVATTPVPEIVHALPIPPAPIEPEWSQEAAAAAAEGATTRPILMTDTNMVELIPVLGVPVIGIVPDNSWVPGRQRLLIFLIIAIFVAVLLSYLLNLVG